MTNSKVQISDYIQQIMNEEEILLRSRTFAPGTIDEVLRYGAIIGNIIEQHEQIPRGIERARQIVQDAEKKNLSFPSGTVILANEMAQSTGRFKRYWHAPEGGLWMTLVLVNTLLPESSLLIPMAAGVACCEVLRDYGIAGHIKWVNDVLVEGKKISGILVETFSGSSSGEEYIMIGIGMNVNNVEFPAGFSEQATSLKSCLKKESSLEEITARLLVKLRWNIGLLYSEEVRHLEINGGIAKRNEPGAENRPEDEHLLLQSYKSLTDIWNRRVIFGFDVQKNPQFEATVIGLDSSGGLILKMDDSTIIVQHSGEIIYRD